MSRLRAACLSALVWTASPPAHAQSSAFTQLGVAHETNAAAIGLTWNWSSRWDAAGGLVTGYWEASVGHWAIDTVDRNDTQSVTQLGVTPVLRYVRASGLFVEGGVGANVVSPRYSSGDTRFGTRFNFGDHLALGWRFGERRRHEVALRVQHFSNGGIRDPNPGEDFVQLRYAIGLD